CNIRLPHIDVINVSSEEKVMSRNQTTRRSVLIGTAAATVAASLPHGTAAQSLVRGPFTVEGWKASWADPSPERVKIRVPTIAAPGIAGYWPRTTRPVRGPQEYAQRIIDLLTFVPDFRA